MHTILRINELDEQYQLSAKVNPRERERESEQRVGVSHQVMSPLLCHAMLYGGFLYVTWRGAEVGHTACLGEEGVGEGVCAHDRADQ